MTTTYSQRFERFMEQFPKSALVSYRDRNSFNRAESMTNHHGRNPMQLDFETASFQEKCLNFFRQEFEQVQGKRLYLMDGLAEPWDFEMMVRELRACEVAIFINIDDVMKRLTEEQVSSFVRVIEDLILADKQVIAFGASKSFAFHFCMPSLYMIGTMDYLEDLRKRRHMI